MHTADRLPELPERIEGLRRLAYNLWWSGQRRAWQLFQMLDPHAFVQVMKRAIKTVAPHFGTRRPNEIPTFSNPTQPRFQSIPPPGPFRPWYAIH
ncbi:MAG: DUF3417 domain-containing protein [Chloroflexota bacterium]